MRILIPNLRYIDFVFPFQKLSQKKLPANKPNACYIIINPVYFVTMCLFPAIVVKIPHQHQQHQNILQQHNKEYIPSAGAGLGVGSEGAAGEKNMHDAEFTCALFRFIQLTCEGHNLGESAVVYTN